MQNLMDLMYILFFKDLLSGLEKDVTWVKSLFDLNSLSNRKHKQKYYNLNLLEMDSIIQLNKKSQVSIKISPPRSHKISISEFDGEIAYDFDKDHDSQDKKSKTFLRKKSNKKQNIKDLFNQIIKSNSQFSHHHILMNKQVGIKKLRIPPSIVNTLYRQNIRNYNPYIATLQQLQQQKSLTLFQKESISNLCHIGISKTFIKTKKYSLEPKYVTVNVLIRTYMRDKMWEQVKYKEQTYDSVFFVPTSQLALSFNPHKIPHGLQEFMPAEFYSKVITKVNHIITTQYVKYKSSNILTISESLSGKLILGILLILSLIFCINKNVILLPIIFGFGIIYILYLIFESKDKLQRLAQSKSIISTIMEKINTLFQSIRTDMIQWKVGKDFYWLEIHYIKRKKRKFNMN